jgi:hypothetical protein
MIKALKIVLTKAAHNPAEIVPLRSGREACG